MYKGRKSITAVLHITEDDFSNCEAQFYIMGDLRYELNKFSQ